MRGMRNRMAHRYYDINLEIAWDTVPDVIDRARAATKKREDLSNPSLASMRF
jgi:uncharacterized protein with HEPN domain